jgi:S-adenosylmethionine/arginine decarboxylase-like enzyme
MAVMFNSLRLKGCAINYKMTVPNVHVQAHVTRLNHANKTSQLKHTKSKFHHYSHRPEGVSIVVILTDS